MRLALRRLWEIEALPGARCPSIKRRRCYRPPDEWRWDRITTALLLTVGVLGLLWSCTGPVS